MTNEEAISVIENEIQIDVRLCTDEQVDKFQTALYMAISALRAEPTGDSLTLEQLREMDGEPVWFDTIKRWGIVKVCRDGVFVLTKSGEFEVGRCKYYRRPPEGEA